MKGLLVLVVLGLDLLEPLALLGQFANIAFVPLFPLVPVTQIFCKVFFTLYGEALHQGADHDLSVFFAHGVEVRRVVVGDVLRSCVKADAESFFQEVLLSLRESLSERALHHQSHNGVGLGLLPVAGQDDLGGVLRPDRSRIVVN